MPVNAVKIQKKAKKAVIKTKFLSLFNADMGFAGAKLLMRCFLNGVGEAPKNIKATDLSTNGSFLAKLIQKINQEDNEPKSRLYNSFKGIFSLLSYEKINPKDPKSRRKLRYLFSPKVQQLAKNKSFKKIDLAEFFRLRSGRQVVAYLDMVRFGKGHTSSGYIEIAKKRQIEKFSIKSSWSTSKSCWKIEQALKALQKPQKRKIGKKLVELPDLRTLFKVGVQGEADTTIRSCLSTNQNGTISFHFYRQEKKMSKSQREYLAKVGADWNQTIFSLKSIVAIIGMDLFKKKIYGLHNTFPFKNFTNEMAQQNYIDKSFYRMTAAAGDKKIVAKKPEKREEAQKRAGRSNQMKEGNSIVNKIIKREIINTDPEESARDLFWRTIEELRGAKKHPKTTKEEEERERLDRIRLRKKHILGKTGEYSITPLKNLKSSIYV